MPLEMCSRCSACGLIFTPSISFSQPAEAVHSLLPIFVVQGSLRNGKRGVVQTDVNKWSKDRTW